MSAGGYTDSYASYVASERIPGGLRLVDIQHRFEDAVKAEVWRERVENDARVLAGDQWDDVEKRDMRLRKQPPMNMNQVHQDYYLQLGRQIRNRMDPTVKALGESSEQIATALDDCIEHLLYTNTFEYVLTDAVRDQLLVRGWIKASFQRDDLSKEPIRLEPIPWREVRMDPVSRDRGLRDCKDLHHERWVDLDDAIAAHPKKKRALRALAGPQREDSPMNHFETRGADPYRVAVQRGDVGKMDYIDASRLRVRLVESWYWRTEQAWQVVYPDGRVELYDEDDPDPKHLRAMFPEERMGPYGSPLPPSPTAKLVEGPHRQFYYVIWTENVVLASGKSPYEHGMYPYFLLDAFRADVTRRNDELTPNEPFGMIRTARDPQKLWNSVVSKIRWILASRQVVMSKGAADRAHVEQNAANPAGIIELSKPDAKFDFVDNLPFIGGLEKLIGIARDQMQASTGVNEASRGLGPEQSGRAILARQQQSELGNTMLVDNQRYAILQIGRALVSMIRQAYTQEKIMRITSARGDRLVAINVTDPRRADELRQRFKKPNGQEGITVHGDIGDGNYGLVVDQVDATLSRREQDNQLMMALLGHLPPTWITANADLLIENMDLANKQEWLERVKQLQQQAQQPSEPPPMVQDKMTYEPIALAPSERAQVLQKMGIQPDPQGGQPQGPQAQPAPPPDPNKMAELQMRGAELQQRQHEAALGHLVKMRDTQVRASSAMHDANMKTIAAVQGAHEARRAHGISVAELALTAARDQQQAEAAKQAAQSPSPSPAGGSS